MTLEGKEPMSRRSKSRRWTRRNSIILGIVAMMVVAGLTGFVLGRRLVRRTWPQTEGTLGLDGLLAPVSVVRDSNGVPYIFAENAHDLFFAQGFVHAQDRFWEMELNRRRGRGELTQLLSDNAIEDDQSWAALDLPAAAAHELTGMDAETRIPLDAYAEGVNAWLEMGRMPFEFTLLGWRGREAVDPDPWKPEDSLIVALVLSVQAGAPPIDQSLAARIAERVTPSRAAFLTDDDPSGSERFARESPLRTLIEDVDSLPQRWALSSQVTLVNGDQAESGKPIMAVDLPTEMGLPAPWYVMAWWIGDRGVQSSSSFGGAAGASVPGLPGLVVGADDRAAWAQWADPPQFALLSLLKELVPSQDTPPWQRWLLAALLSDGAVVQPDGDQGPRTAGDLQAQQQGTYSARAERLLSQLVQIEPEGWRQERVTEMLRGWDYHVGDNNKESPFFVVYQLELARAAFADELGAALFDAYVAQSDLYQDALDRILEYPEDVWWDDVTTPQRENRDDILKYAYEPALEWIGRNYGDLHMLWEWDIVHGGRLHHALGDAWPWDQFFSRDIYPDGWVNTTNASPGGLPCTGNMCMGGDIFRAKAVYGYRQVLDASDPSTLWFTLLPGQSGHPFHAHYDDLLDEWLAGEYLPLRLAASPQEVQGVTSVLELKTAAESE